MCVCIPPSPLGGASLFSSGASLVCATVLVTAVMTAVVTEMVTDVVSGGDSGNDSSSGCGVGSSGKWWPIAIQ
jgi:hypothetical protein